MNPCDLDTSLTDKIKPRELMSHQQQALEVLSNGKILWGGVGAGKSAVAMAYYVKNEMPRDIYVITTAKKRDSLEWLKEAAHYAIADVHSCSAGGVLTVDSWNNIARFSDIEGAFFVFDEQRVVGSGAWVKSFLQIARKNHWILLSATPGDTWMDYIPVFVANGYFRSRSEFIRNHVNYEPFVKFPKVRGYVGEAYLEKLREEILVEMPYPSHTTRILNFLEVGYDKEEYNHVRKTRVNPFDRKPFKDAAELWRFLRFLTNSDDSRLNQICKLLQVHDRLIVFYTFDYELEILRGLAAFVTVGEWNGHRKTPIPETDKWVYLVQYTSGAESWNCIDTNAMVLYSLPYSYKQYVQCMGRIDRLDTPFTDLYYYILVSRSGVDLAVKAALDGKRSFNEARAVKSLVSTAYPRR